MTGIGAPVDATGPDFEPISGVSLAQYAEISKNLASVNYDQSRSAEVAARFGVSADDWATAVAGWNARMTANREVGKVFNSLYTQG